jgi:transcriptional regulator with XRE-family HTH domain
MSRSDSGIPAPTCDALRIQRETVGLSLRALARRSGYSTSYLSRVETGQRSVTAAVARLYATLSPTESGPAAKQALNTFPKKPAAAIPDLGVAWFGSEVRRLRMAAGKSLDALGTEVYLSRSYLGRIEQGDARGSYQLALSLDAALAAQGRLVRLFLEECARVGPVAPDTDILPRGGPVRAAAHGLDPAELASAAAARLEALRIRSHQAGPHTILRDLGNGIAELYNATGDPTRSAGSPVWPVTLRYAELLGWTAQETGHDRIALRWTCVLADWARTLGDVDALSYALIRHSQRARRRGDVAAAVEFARRAGAVPGVSPRVAQFAAQRETQACALAGDEAAFRRTLDRYRMLVAEASGLPAEPTLWGPAPDPVFERSRLFEATCLIDLADFRGAASLFDEGMKLLRSERTGYARLAVRQAIAYAQVGEPEHACEIVLGSLPTVARQGSASLRGDLKQVARALNRHHRSPAVRALLPDLAALARADSSRHPAESAPAATSDPPDLYSPDDRGWQELAVLVPEPAERRDADGEEPGLKQRAGLAERSAAQLAAAMATERWGAARDAASRMFALIEPARCAALVGRLDQDERSLGAATAEVRDRMRERIALRWEGRLEELLARHPAMRDRLEILIAQLRACAAQPGKAQTTVNQQRVEANGHGTAFRAQGGAVNYYASPAPSSSEPSSDVSSDHSPPAEEPTA